MRERFLLISLLLACCANPVRDAEGALAAGESLHALRLARDALRNPELKEQPRKRLGAVLQSAAHALLDAPDHGTAEEAREVWQAMPDGSVERVRAAQRYFRVRVRGMDEAGFHSALEELEPHMGSESQVRSNLRTLSQSTRGQPVCVLAAGEVVKRWPDDADRWMDLAAAYASLGAWKDAQASVLSALNQLQVYCADLPRRLESYDPVMRKSAYGELEIKRCQGFSRLAAAWSGYQRKQEQPGGTAVQEQAPASTSGKCPTHAPMHALVEDEHTAAVMVTPHPRAWWLDGHKVPEVVTLVVPGSHVMEWQDEKGCHQHTFDVAAGATRVVQIALPAKPSP